MMSWITLRPAPKAPASTGADVAESAARWRSFYECLMVQLFDYEMSRETCAKQIALCSEMADLALEEYERRWTR
jgi:hypothetical protein